MKIKTLLFIAALCLAVTPAFAAPTIESPEDQSFDQYQNIEQVRDITITDDATTPVITASGDIRIKIPTSFPVIWDDRVTSVNLDGSAVTAGRFSNGTAPVSYEDADKTAVIDVAENFAAGESVTIAGLFLEGFYWSDANAKLQLIVQEGESAVATDVKSMQVWISSNEDSHEPEAPSNLQLTQTEDDKVKITWTDAPDMDASQVQILRGVAPLPVAGNAYAEEGRGVEQFIDADVEIGDTVSYILRSSDGRNISGLSEEVTITLVENPEPEPVVCTADYDPVCGSDDETYANACNAEAAGITEYTAGECVTETPTETPEEPTVSAEEQKATEAGITLTELQNAVSDYSDLATDHWSAGFLARLTRDSILGGYPDGTVQPDTTINRAELAKITANAFGLTTNTSESSFTDVTASDWFNPFVNALQAIDATWTSSGEFFPAAGVSRGEAVWVLAIASGASVPEVTEKPFPDVSTSHPYAAAIGWAKEQGIISGYDPSTSSGQETVLFGLRDTLTRAQVAKMVTLIRD